jgi:hypothetical protein
MNSIVLAGRTVRVSKEVTFKREDDKNDGKVTYVTIAVRHPGRDEDDFFTLRFFGGLSTVAQEQLNLKDPNKLANENIDNKIYSRTFSVNGHLKIFDKEVIYEIEVEGVEGTIEFVIDKLNAVIDVDEIILLDAQPSFMKEKQHNRTAKTMGQKIKAKIKSYKESERITDDEIPM